MHNTVTTNATEMVRTVAVRNTASVSTRTMLSLVKVCTTAPVNALVVQNAETSSTASEPRYATTSQASGGMSNNARLMRRPDNIDIRPRTPMEGDIRGRCVTP